MLTGICWWMRERRDPITRVIYRLMQGVYGAFISPHTEFANRPCFPHGMHGIFTSGEAVVGKDCVIFQHVTIGYTALKGSKNGAPVIGDNCYIGTGACVIGPITIGNNVRIGAGTTVYQDVPDNTTVVSAAQRVIHHDTPPDNRFRTRKKGKWYVWDGGQLREDEE